MPARLPYFSEDKKTKVPEKAKEERRMEKCTFCPILLSSMAYLSCSHRMCMSCVSMKTIKLLNGNMFKILTKQIFCDICKKDVEAKIVKRLDCSCDIITLKRDEILPKLAKGIFEHMMEL